MAKGSGNTRNGRIRKSATDSNIEHLQNSKNWLIAYGMQSYDRGIANGDDFSDMKNMNESEKRVVTAYLSNAYRVVNSSLRGGEYSADGELLANEVSKALKKAESRPGTSFRYISFDNSRQYSEFMSQFSKDSIYQEKGFMSTGLNKERLKRKFYYSDRQNVSIEIRGRNGKNFTHYNHEEKEILYDKGTRFRVISKSSKKIVLEEI